MVEINANFLFIFVRSLHQRKTYAQLTSRVFILAILYESILMNTFNDNLYLFHFPGCKAHSEHSRIAHVFRTVQAREGNAPLGVSGFHPSQKFALLCLAGKKRRGNSRILFDRNKKVKYWLKYE